MREILFRGKTIPRINESNGLWVEGSLILANNYCCILEKEENLHPMDVPYLNGEYGIIDGCATPIIPETVGQYTGLTDKNGTKIFEGDILSSSWGYKGAVEYDTIMYAKLECLFNEDCEVIGNIHDNPELLGGAE